MAGMSPKRKSAEESALYRHLPSVDEILRLPAVVELVRQDGVAVVTDTARGVLARLRDEIAGSRLDERGLKLAVDNMAEAVARQLRQVLEHSLRPVINATGVVLHTNLGRSPLAGAVIEHIRETSTAFSNLEFDLETGERGRRDIHVQRLFAKLLSVDAGYDLETVVVNNCAAAVMVALNSLGTLSTAMQAGFNDVSRACLVAAIAALGMKTSFAQLARAGWRPLALIVIETVWIAGFVLAVILIRH